MYLLIAPFLLLANIAYSQIPTIRAIGGEGTAVNWPQLKQSEDPEGPGYFYNDCSQGVEPIGASSTLAPQGSKSYGVKNLSDDNPMSAWVEGKADYGIGTYFEISTPGVNVIYNGYQSSVKSWLDNSRVKKFKVYKDGEPLCFLELTDEMGAQHFELPGHNHMDLSDPSIFRFEIVEVYPGLKWKDVAISEIDLTLCCIGSASQVSTPRLAQTVCSLAVGDRILAIDLNNQSIYNTTVQKITKAKHLSMLRIVCDDKEFICTAHHPLYTEKFGFISMAKYANLLELPDFSSLVGTVYIGLYDKNPGKVIFKPLSSVEVLEGVFETYNIKTDFPAGTYITNGFINCSY